MLQRASAVNRGAEKPGSRAPATAKVQRPIASAPRPLLTLAGLLLHRAPAAAGRAIAAAAVPAQFPTVDIAVRDAGAGDLREKGRAGRRPLRKRLCRTEGKGRQDPQRVEPTDGD